MGIKVPAIAGKIIHIGRAGEHLATTVEFDVSDWIKPENEGGFGNEGTFSLFVQQGGNTIYSQIVNDTDEISNGKVLWDITNANTAIIGLGKCELFYSIDTGETDEEENPIFQIVKSVIYDIVVTNSLDSEAAGDTPSPIEAWIAQVSQMAAEISDAAGHAEDAERWAKGTKEGVPVTSGNGYHDNAKYYKEAAATSASNAAGSATEAAQSAIEAQNSVGSAYTAYLNASSSAATASNFAIKAEQWARGTKEGVPVRNNEDGFEDNAKYYAERIQSLGIGTVTTGSAGSNATASINLDLNNNALSLNLTIPRGNKGDKGEQGNGLRIIDTKTDVLQLPSAVSAGAGTAYGVGSSVPYDIYISNGTNSGGTYNGWINFGKIGGASVILITWTT